MADALKLRTSSLEFSALAEGEPGAPLVLCLHGFPDSPSTFGHQLRALADAGFRVVAPALRGYEPSSIPEDGDLSLMALADDVIAWLDELGVERAHLVGHDWGAAISYVAAGYHPERFHTLTTLAIPPLARVPAAVRKVPRQVLRSWYMTFFQIPWVSDRALKAGDWWLMRRLWRTWSPGYTQSEPDRARLIEGFDQPGVVGAALAYYRQNATPPLLLGLTSSPAMERATISVPTLVLHGADDRCMDRRLYSHAVIGEDYPLGVKVVEVPDAGHFLHLERPDVVNAAIAEHIGAPSG